MRKRGLSARTSTSGFGLVLLCALAANCLTARAQDGGANLANAANKLTEELRQLPPAQRQEKIRRLMQLGLFLNTPEFWRECDDLKLCLRFIDQYGEPLNAPMLDALERNLNASRQPLLQRRAAALLYRYNREVGGAYLLRALQSRDATAATIFALNREASVLPDILRILVEAKGDDRNDPELVEALGNWKNPAIERALLRNFEVALAKDEVGYANYASALAAQGARDAIPTIWKLYKQLPPQDTLSRPEVAAALIRLQVPQSEQLMGALLAQFATKEQQFARRRVLEAIGQTGTARAETVLKAAIENYLATQNPPPARRGETIEQTDADELATVAAEQLAKSKAKATQDLLSRLLLRLAADDAIKERPTLAMKARVARSLLNLNEARNHDLVVQVMGEKWLQNELAIRSLKFLPASL